MLRYCNTDRSGASQHFMSTQFPLFCNVLCDTVSNTNTNTQYHFLVKERPEKRGFIGFYSMMHVWLQTFGNNEFVFRFGNVGAKKNNNNDDNDDNNSVPLSCPKDFVVWCPGKGQRAHVDFQTTIRWTSDTAGGISNVSGVFVPFTELYRECSDKHSGAFALLWMPKDGFRVCVPTSSRGMLPLRIHAIVDNALLAVVWPDGSAVFSGTSIDETLAKLLMVWGIYTTRIPDGLCRVCTHCPICQHSSVSLPEYHVFAEHLLNTLHPAVFGFEDSFPRKINDSEFWYPPPAPPPARYQAWARDFEPGRFLRHSENFSCFESFAMYEMDSKDFFPPLVDGCFPPLLFSKSGCIQNMMEEYTNVQECHTLIVSELRKQKVSDPDKSMRVLDHIMREDHMDYTLHGLYEIAHSEREKNVHDIVIDLIVTAHYLGIVHDFFSEDDDINNVPPGVTKLEFYLTKLLGEIMPRNALKKSRKFSATSSATSSV
jgi:hypothetical protein